MQSTATQEQPNQNPKPKCTLMVRVDGFFHAESLNSLPLKARTTLPSMLSRFHPGTLWMIASAASFAVMAASAKMLPEISALEKVFFRSLISVVLTAWALRRAKVSWRPHQPGLLFLRAIFGFGGLYCYFECISRIPLGSAVTIYNTTPLFAAVIGVALLGERLKGLQVFSLFLGVAGIAFIKGFSADVTWVGVGFGLGTAVFSAIAYSLVRVLSRAEHPLVIVMAFPLISLPLAWIGGGSDFLLPSGVAWLWLLLLGLGAQGGQICLTYGLQHHTATRATQIGFIGVIFAMVLGIPLGDGIPGLAQFLGAGIVFLSLSLGRKKSKPRELVL
jgi:drug/metabolite transporter (DMT)-like permease